MLLPSKGPGSICSVLLVFLMISLFSFLSMQTSLILSLIFCYYIYVHIHHMHRKCFLTMLVFITTIFYIVLRNCDRMLPFVQKYGKVNALYPICAIFYRKSTRC